MSKLLLSFDIVIYALLGIHAISSKYIIYYYYNFRKIINILL